jgi:hypothetical protein
MKPCGRFCQRQILPEAILRQILPQGKIGFRQVYRRIVQRQILPEAILRQILPTAENCSNQRQILPNPPDPPIRKKLI